MLSATLELYKNQMPSAGPLGSAYISVFETLGVIDMVDNMVAKFYMSASADIVIVHEIMST